MRIADQLQVAANLLAAARSQWWSAARIREFQDRALVRMMRHAISNVPFYRRLNLSAGSIAVAADLARFPIIGKRDVQRDPHGFLADGFAPASLYSSRTSGSSGQPTTTYFARDAWLLSKYALKMRRVLATSGFPLGRRVLIISEQPPDQLGAIAAAAPSGLGLLYQQRHLSIHTPVAQHLAAIAQYRPHIIYAYPSYLLDLIVSAERDGVALPSVATLYTSSEVLTAAARSRIEKAFSGKLYDVYGSTEFKEVAWQCREGRYHLNIESVYLEPQEPGRLGTVILSSLCNFAMPLLRFEIGDRAAFDSNACACGRASPQLGEFAGREGDIITLPSRRRLSPYLLTTAIETAGSILQYRIVQTHSDAFRIDVTVRSPGESAMWRSRLCAELERVTGEPVRFEVREVDALERDPGGKRSVFVRALAG
jgi:phenylacetate-CoA ligase